VPPLTGILQHDVSSHFKIRGNRVHKLVTAVEIHSSVFRQLLPMLLYLY